MAGQRAVHLGELCGEEAVLLKRLTSSLREVSLQSAAALEGRIAELHWHLLDEVKQEHAEVRYLLDAALAEHREEMAKAMFPPLRLVRARSPEADRFPSVGTPRSACGTPRSACGTPRSNPHKTQSAGLDRGEQVPPTGMPRLTVNLQASGMSYNSHGEASEVSNPLSYVHPPTESDDFVPLHQEGLMPEISTPRAGEASVSTFEGKLAQTPLAKQGVTSGMSKESLMPDISTPRTGATVSTSEGRLAQTPLARQGATSWMSKETSTSGVSTPRHAQPSVSTCDGKAAVAPPALLGGSMWTSPPNDQEVAALGVSAPGSGEMWISPSQERAARRSFPKLENFWVNETEFQPTVFSSSDSSSPRASKLPGSEMTVRRRPAIRPEMPIQLERYPLLASIVFSMKFECFCSAFIVCNCVMIGLEAHDFATGQWEATPRVRSALEVSEHFFTGFFLMELALRFTVQGVALLDPSKSEGRANLFDATIVVLTGLILGWLVPLLALLSGLKTDGSVLRSITALRAFRLARLVRVFRKMPLFPEAWMLIRGLSASCRTLFWTVIVIFFVTYIFAVFGLMLMVPEIADARGLASCPEEVEILESLWKMLGGIDRLMYTLIQVLTMDSFHGFMRQILVYVPWSWVYWYAYMAVACFVLMNLVTAIIVENAFSSSRNDLETAAAEKALKQKRELGELKKLFSAMDTDGDGTLNWAEFQDSFADPFLKSRWTMLDFKPEEGRELFALLDDGDGAINTTEFFEGLSRMKGSAQSKDLYKLQKSINQLRREIQPLLDQDRQSKKHKL